MVVSAVSFHDVSCYERLALSSPRVVGHSAAVPLPVADCRPELAAERLAAADDDDGGLSLIHI